MVSSSESHLPSSSNDVLVKVKITKIHKTIFTVHVSCPPSLAAISFLVAGNLNCVAIFGWVSHLVNT